MTFPTDLNPIQKILITSIFANSMPTFRKYDIHAIFNAILYVVKTGCQWNMLPQTFPNWKTVYHHFRSFSEKNGFSKALIELVAGRRCSLGDCPDPFMGVIDSESVGSGLTQSEKGIDGHKKVKGIKRQILTDNYGYPLLVHTTYANIHDTKGIIPLLQDVEQDIPSLKELMADKGYTGSTHILEQMGIDIRLRCVKSNYGTSDFVPLEGRWVVERTISWLSNYRRLTRNYEKYLYVARNMYIVGCIAFMLRYFR